METGTSQQSVEFTQRTNRGGSRIDKKAWCSDRDFSARETSEDEIDADKPSRVVGPRLGGA